MLSILNPGARGRARDDAVGGAAALDPSSASHCRASALLATIGQLIDDGQANLEAAGDGLCVEGGRRRFLPERPGRARAPGRWGSERCRRSGARAVQQV